MKADIMDVVIDMNEKIESSQLANTSKSKRVRSNVNNLKAEYLKDVSIF